MSSFLYTSYKEIGLSWSPEEYRVGLTFSAHSLESSGVVVNTSLSSILEEALQSERHKKFFATDPSEEELCEFVYATVSAMLFAGGDIPRVSLDSVELKSGKNSVKLSAVTSSEQRRE